MLDDRELNMEVIKNVYGFFVTKEKFKLTLYNPNYFPPEEKKKIFRISHHEIFR